MRQFKRKPVAEINVVPYVDVMLVLLVIFMITTPLLTAGVDVDLPKASAKALPEKSKEPLVLSVDKEGLYYLNVASDPKQAMDSDAVLLRVAAELKRDGERPVLVRGDKNVPYGDVVSAMVLLQQAGAENVGLITEDDGQKKSKS